MRNADEPTAERYLWHVSKNMPLFKTLLISFEVDLTIIELGNLLAEFLWPTLFSKYNF